MHQDRGSPWPKPPWAGDHLDVYKDFVKKVLTSVGPSRLRKPGLSSLVGSFYLFRMEECRCQAAVLCNVFASI